MRVCESGPRILSGKSHVAKPPPPPGRVVSASIHTDEDVSSHLSHMITQMGQFVDHDVTLTPELVIEECCEEPEQEGCFPIDVEGDDFFDGEHGEVGGEKMQIEHI